MKHAEKVIVAVGGVCSDDIYILHYDKISDNIKTVGFQCSMDKSTKASRQRQKYRNFVG